MARLAQSEREAKGAEKEKEEGRFFPRRLQGQAAKGRNLGKHAIAASSSLRLPSTTKKKKKKLLSFPLQFACLSPRTKTKEKSPDEEEEEDEGSAQTAARAFVARRASCVWVKREGEEVRCGRQDRKERQGEKEGAPR